MTKQNNLTPKEKFTAATYMGNNADTFGGMGVKEAAEAIAAVLQRPVTASNVTTVAEMADVDLSSHRKGPSELDELRKSITAIQEDVDKLTASLARLWERDAPLQAGDHGTLEEKII